MDELKEPVLCAPNDPDDARLLSEVQGTKIDEVGSNINHVAIQIYHSHVDLL